MKIGIFDSGLGGLLVARAIRKAMPQYDYVYLGDTKRVPYGNRSAATVYEFSREAVEHLLQKEKCSLVIIACNTASARALSQLQKDFPRKKILGVLVPASEEAAKFGRIAVLATAGTVASGSFVTEIKKRNPEAKVFQNPAPLLVPLAEAGETGADIFVKKYLAPFKGKKIEALVLGCTHYPIFKKEFKRLFGNTAIVSQDEIVPKKLKNYLARHPEIEKKLSRGGTAKILVTDETATIDKLARKWFGNVIPKLVKL
jgi:glutamate racemase